MSTPRFTEEQVQRYARHIILPNIGGAGQRKLLDASVLVIGAGGLGSPIAMYLAAAGIGRLGIIDFDRVDVSNLQRQILHTDGDVGLTVPHLPAIGWSLLGGGLALLAGGIGAVVLGARRR